MSKNYNQSDYGKNRYRTGIVFSAADKDYELTKEQFLASDPTLTEADYDFWKKWSDEDYKAEDRAGTHESKHTLAIEQFEETELVSENTVEEIALERLEPHQNPYTIKTAMAILDSCLTAVQKKRYLLNKRDGMTLERIAEMENVSITAVFYSISAAEKNISRYLARHT